MASKTPNLDLLKKDPVADGNDTFNIETMLNENWDKIDAAVGEVREELKEVHVPSATLTEPGIVQLSSATNSSSEALAATPKAVKSAYDAAVAAQATANAANSAAAAAQNTANSANSAAASAQNTANTSSSAAASALARADAANNAIGPLSVLLTGDKSSAVAAINEVFTSGVNAKKGIVEVINAMGGRASTTDTWTTLATKIQQISTIKPGDLVVFTVSGSVTSSTDPYLAFNVKAVFAGTYRVKYTFYSNSSDRSANSRVTVNGVNFVPDMSTYRDFKQVSLDIPLTPNDELKIYGWMSSNNTARNYLITMTSLTLGVDLSFTAL